MKSFPWLLLGVALALTLPLRADGVSQRQMNYGSSLLHHLLEQESLVHLIKIAKTTPPDVVQLIGDASATADAGIKVLDGFGQDDPRIQFGLHGLPVIEDQARASIKAEEQQMLLFGTKGNEFAKALVVTQIEAAAYASNMAKVMADAETSSHRAEALRRMSGRWMKVKSRAYGILYEM